MKIVARIDELLHMQIVIVGHSLPYWNLEM